MEHTRSKARHYLCSLPFLLFALATPYALAQDAGQAEDPRDATIRELRAQLAAQEQRMESFSTRLAAAEQSDENAARTEALKQQIREVLSETEFRESLMPSTLQAGYDGGFFIKSSDEKFRMNINGLMQIRWTYYAAQKRNHYLTPRLPRDDRSGLDVTRMRLRFSGNVYDPNLTYAVELEQDANDGYNTILGEGWANYRFVDEFQIKAGYFRPGTTRMQMMDNANMQLIDRSMVDAVFGAGYAVGVRFWGVACNKRVEYSLDVLNSIAEGESTAVGRVITTDGGRELDNNPALAFRTVWHALSEDPGNDFLEDSDLQNHAAPALDLGFHYLFNEDDYDVFTTRVPFPLPRRALGQGGFGVTNSNELQIHQFGIDTAFKYMGFSATGEYIVRLLDVRDATGPSLSPLYWMTRESSTSAQHGAYVQLGYFLPIPGLEKKLEAVARVGGISALAGDQEASWEYAAGLNYYLHGNKVKLQADVTKITEAPISAPYSSMANVNDDPLVFRMQLQVAF